MSKDLLHNRESCSTGSGCKGNNRGDFASLLKKWNPPIPPALSRKLGRGSESPLGKVKVMLRVCENGDEKGGIIGLDQRRKQVTLIDPNGITPEESRRVGVSAPKMFAFDGIFGEDDDQGEICSASVAELVASVMSGEDGTLVSLGVGSAKKATMFGKPLNGKLGAVPTAISWLFRCIQEQRQKTGGRYSVRCSALEVTGGSVHETITDLLAPFLNDSDPHHHHSQLGVCLEGKGGPSTILSSMSEVRAPTAESAGLYLDSALASASQHNVGGGGGGHFLFTLHLYQYSMDKGGKGVVGGRSRLHCISLGSGQPSISVLSGLLLAVLNAQRHLPSSNHSKLGGILRECLGSLTCRAVVMIHVSNSHSRYAESLAALQLGSRVHRLRRSRRLKGSVGSCGSGGSSGGSGEEMRSSTTNAATSGGGGVVPKDEGLVGGEGSSEFDPSSSEQSCDTVIYCGPSIDEGTDGEHPPLYLTSAAAAAAEKSVTPGATATKRSEMSKCPKSSTKISKPKHNGGGGGGSKEKWVDGPKYGETWIDGPAARINSNSNHQAVNFPSPKKLPLQPARRVESCLMNSTKTEMIQRWISNQGVTISPFDDGNLFQPTAEYKALTVFKTAEVEDEEDGGGGRDEFEFEFIEVVEPQDPVAMKDVALQVTEEDIISCMGENELPESDQNFLDLHPLKVLSQECLTVVSNFTGGEWPNHDNCHGLCKNLVTLSQMSLDNLCNFPLPPVTAQRSLPRTEKGKGMRRVGMDPIHFKDSDAEESIIIPPMELIDVAQIKNNLVKHSATPSLPNVVVPSVTLIQKNVPSGEAVLPASPTHVVVEPSPTSSPKSKSKSARKIAKFFRKSPKPEGTSSPKISSSSSSSSSGVSSTSSKCKGPPGDLCNNSNYNYSPESPLPIFLPLSCIMEGPCQGEPTKAK